MKAQEADSFSGLGAADSSILLLPVSQHQRPELLLRLLQQQHHLVLLLADGGWAGGGSEGRVFLPLVLLAGHWHHVVYRAEAGLHARRLAVVVTLDGGDDGDRAGADRGRGTAVATSGLAQVTGGGTGIKQSAQAWACTAAPKWWGHGNRRLPVQEGVLFGVVTLVFTLNLATKR